MILTKSPVFLNDPAGPVPRSAPVVRFLCRFSLTFPTQLLIPALRSGHRLLQRLSTQKQIPSSLKATIATLSALAIASSLSCSRKTDQPDRPETTSTPVVSTAPATAKIPKTAKAPKTPAAQPAPPSALAPDTVFKRLDTNGDGNLSFEEFKATPIGKRDETKAEEIFKKWDVNGDGGITLEEFKSKRQDQPAPPSAFSPDAVFKRLDTNGDGNLGFEEFKATPIGKRDETKAEEFFKKWYVNGDGGITLEEFKSQRQAPARTPATPAQ
jgi:calmodulin